MMGNTDLFDEAIIFATKAHKDVMRKVSNYPYIIHPMEAATIVATMSNDNRLLAAAVLHDIAEDTEYTLLDIEERFGPDVARLVSVETDTEVGGATPQEAWYNKKRNTLSRLKNAKYDEKIVALGDKLSNMRTIARDYQHMGDKVWKRFVCNTISDQSWYYLGLLDALSDLKDTDAYQEFATLTGQVFGG